MKIQDARDAARELSEAYRALAAAYAAGDEDLAAAAEERIEWCEGVLDHALCTLEDVYECEPRGLVGHEAEEGV